MDHIVFYAVLRNASDGDYSHGSYDFEHAKSMLQRLYPDTGCIAVVDAPDTAPNTNAQNLICLDLIPAKELLSASAPFDPDAYLSELFS